MDTSDRSGAATSASHDDSPQAKPGNLGSGAHSSTAGGSDAGSLAASITTDMAETAKLATQAVKEHATQFAAEVGHELGATAEDQKVRGAEALLGFARAINTAAGELESQSPLAARYARDTAERVEGLSGSIRNRNVTELIHTAAELAKSQPMLFFGSAMAAGFALSRFLKSSAVGAPSAKRTPESATAEGGT